MRGSRKTAVLITVVVAILATLFGVNRSLNGLARDIEDTFYTGAVYDGYRHPSIDSQLRKQMEAAVGIVTIAQKYEELAEMAGSMDRVRLELIAAGSNFEKGVASFKMRHAFDNMREAYLKAALTEQDKAWLEDYYSTFEGAYEVIQRERAVYNAAVAQFDEGKSYSFIASILKPLAFVEPPQMFDYYIGLQES